MSLGSPNGTKIVPVASKSKTIAYSLKYITENKSKNPVGNDIWPHKITWLSIFSHISLFHKIIVLLPSKLSTDMMHRLQSHNTTC
jgi:hypothetical protein